jgi:hypothetical protein
LNRKLDITLNIKGPKTLNDSFKDLATGKVIEHTAGEQDLLHERHGVIFQAFPSVLHLHLERTESAGQGGATVSVRPITCSLCERSHQFSDR